MSRRTDEHGFTLTEVVVAVALTLLVGMALLRFFDSAVAGSVELQTSTRRHTDARLAIDGLVRELRQTYAGDPATPAVEAIGPQAITFHSPDTSTPMGLRKISYRVQDGALERQVTASTGGPPWTFPGLGPWVPVMEIREGDVFTGMGSTGATTFDPAAVRQVAVKLTGRNSDTRADRPFQVTVKLRNLG